VVRAETTAVPVGADAWFEVTSGLDRAAAGLDVTLGDAEVGVLGIFPVVMPEASLVDVLVAVRNGASVGVLELAGVVAGVLELAGTLVGVVVGVLVVAGTLVGVVVGVLVLVGVVGVVGVLGAIAVGVAVGVPRSPTPIVGVGVGVDGPIVPDKAEGVDAVATVGSGDVVGIGVFGVPLTMTRPSVEPAAIAVAPDGPCTCSGTLLDPMSLLPSCPL